MPKPIILASGSPRRKELLTMLALPFTVDLPTEFVEFTGQNEPDPAALVLKNSQGKVKAVAPRHPGALILGVDTVVFCEGQILEKPKDREDAFRMLKQLQGRSHQVFTAQVLLDTESERQLESVDQTTVTFLPMTDEQIRAYIATDEPMDKAGAYAAQGIGAQFIQKIDGDFFTVVGLSVSRFMTLYTRLDQAAETPVN